MNYNADKAYETLVSYVFSYTVRNIRGYIIVQAYLI